MLESALRRLGCISVAASRAVRPGQQTPCLRKPGFVPCLLEDLYRVGCLTQHLLVPIRRGLDAQLYEQANEHRLRTQTAEPGSLGCSDRLVQDRLGLREAAGLEQRFTVIG